ncbi:MAG: two-component sensor histidine kinase, partial [Bradymonadia bacterium]
MAEQAKSAKNTAASGGDAALDAGNYEVIRARLLAQGKALRAKAETLNGERKGVFGGTELVVAANSRVRTANNCIPRDIVSVGGHLLLGYTVTFGLKQETNVADVFGLHLFTGVSDGDGDAEFPKVDLAEAGGFLEHPQFQKDFVDLFRYFRDTRLLQIRKVDGQLLAVFQVGANLTDIKVFRWRVRKDGGLDYIDNRGDRDYLFPASHDFDWLPTTRGMQVHGEHPHVNINDTIFVETVGGDLTIKVEDNTGDGTGIYAEPVDDANQTLDDGEIHYAILGQLILLKIKPYREETYRYLVYNTRTQGVARIDAIGLACVQLPEDHGLIFPGGYYLASGDYKVFEGVDGHRFKRMIRSPNGEDALYIFYEQATGHYALLPYNLIRKEVQTPIQCHGYSLFEDGQMVIFRSVNDEPTRVHPVQVWQTPYTSAEFAASAPTDDSFLSRVGNAELVRGISDALSISRLIDDSQPSRQIFEDLIGAIQRMKDAYYWIGKAEVGDLGETLAELTRTTELIVDEFEKVVAFRTRAKEALAEAEASQKELLRTLRATDLSSVDAFMGGLTALRQRRGHLITMREIRYIDTARLDEMEKEAIEHFERLTRECVIFLQRDAALGPLKADIEALFKQVEVTEKVAEINPLRAHLASLSEGLDLLTEVISGLQIDDATARTAILEDISEVFGQLNRVRATLENRRKSLMGREGRAEFGAQFKLFGQSVASALSMCDTPERCDEEQSRLMIQLEELEARFSELDEFLGDLASKREEVYEAFSARKQTLLDERQRRVGNLIKAADRILEGVARRARGFKDEDELNAYFASDNMVSKLRQIAEQLIAVGDSVKSEELLAKLKGSKQDAIRGLRDKLDLYEGGGTLIRLGTHQFTVNTQQLELTMVPRDGEMVLHLTGTDFYEPIEDEAFLATRPYWPQTVVSETATVYRAEYLAASILEAADTGEGGLTFQALLDAQRGEGLLAVVREKAQSRYDEGYERGLHDSDATLILEKLVAMRTSAGLLRFPAHPRGLAALFWGALAKSSAPEDKSKQASWQRKSRNLVKLRERFGHSPALRVLGDALATAMTEWIQQQDPANKGLAELAAHATLAGQYLLEELAAAQPKFTTSRDAEDLRAGLMKHLEETGGQREFEQDLRTLKDDVVGRLELAV